MFFCCCICNKHQNEQGKNIIAVNESAQALYKFGNNAFQTLYHILLQHKQRVVIKWWLCCCLYTFQLLSSSQSPSLSDSSSVVLTHAGLNLNIHQHGNIIEDMNINLKQNRWLNGLFGRFIIQNREIFFFQHRLMNE